MKATDDGDIQGNHCSLSYLASLTQISPPPL
jgi:hypothetical protein